MWRVATPAQRLALAQDLVAAAAAAGSWEAATAQDDGAAALYEAAAMTIEAGDSASLRLLLPGVSTLPLRDFHALLNDAACFGRYDALEDLCDARAPLLPGTDPAVPANEDVSLALHAAAASGHARCIVALLRRGFALEGRDRLGHTPLWRAVTGQQTEAALVLLKAGADVRVADRLRRYLWDTEAAQRVPRSRAGGGEEGTGFVAAVGPRNDDDALSLLRVLLLGPASLPAESSAVVAPARHASTSVSAARASMRVDGTMATSSSVAGGAGAHAQPPLLRPPVVEPPQPEPVTAAPVEALAPAPAPAAVSSRPSSPCGSETRPHSEDHRNRGSSGAGVAVAPASAGGDAAAAAAGGTGEQVASSAGASKDDPPVAAAPKPAPAPAFGTIPPPYVWLDRLREALTSGESAEGETPRPPVATAEAAFRLLDPTGLGRLTPTQLLSRCADLGLGPFDLSVVAEEGDGEAAVVAQAVAAALGLPLDTDPAGLTLDVTALEQFF